MKKLVFLFLFSLTLGLTSKAQDDKKEDKDKAKKTSTLGQKVHNTFSKHKKYSGYKIKHEHNGVKHKKKVNTKTGETKIKVD